jgi:hypothetical protein
MTNINNPNKRVFVSSTVYDLIDIRSEIEGLLRDFGLIPVMSDSRNDGFDSTIQSNSIETCLVNLRNCAQVILILSQRYGPSLGEHGFTDHSATHLEYVEAKKHNIPVYFYARDQLMGDFSTWKKAPDKESLKLPWVIEKKQYRIFNLINERTALSENSINWVSTFTNSIDLKKQIQRDLKLWADNVTFWDDVENNKIPILFPSQELKINSSNPSQLYLKFKNCGTVPASNILISIDSQQDDEKGWHFVLPPNETITTLVTIYDFTNLNHDEHIRIEYEDTKGRKYEDSFVVTIKVL